MIKLPVHILPAHDVFYDTQESKVDLSHDRQLYMDSLKKWVTTIQPSVLFEHEPDGQSYGKVTEIFEDEDGLKGYIELIDGLELKGKLRFVSPRIAWNYVDVDGNKWPAALLELSLVSIPRFSNQLEIGAMVNKESKPEIVMSEYSDIKLSIEGEKSIMDPMVLEELKKMIKEEVASLMNPEPEEVMEEEVKEEVEMQDAPLEEVEAEDAAMESAMTLTVDELMTMAEEERKELLSTMSYEDKASMLEELLEAKSVEAEEAVMSDVRKYVKSEESVKSLMKVYKSDKKGFQSLMSDLKSKDEKPVSRKVRITPSVSIMSAVKENSDSKADRALRLADKEGISFAEALAKLG
jgi:hypothetical protein